MCQKSTQTSRTQLGAFVIDGDVLKGPSVFGFKYIPQDGKKTAPEDSLLPKASQIVSKRHAAERDPKMPQYPEKIDRWIERYYFCAFVAGCGTLVVVMGIVVKMVMVVVGRMG